MADERFLKGTERLIDPITVGTVHFAQQMFGMLPLGMQRRMLEKAAARTPHMGFVVEPYAFFLFYKISDEKRAELLLPKGFKLARTSAFEGDEAASYAIISLFRIHTSTFWGARAELYFIAENERTGLLSWIIADYLSDTVSYDRANGLRAPSAPGAVMAASSEGRVVADFADEVQRRAIALNAPLAHATARPLDQRLWVEGNTSIAYGPWLSPGEPGTFALTFQPSEMTEALEIPVEDVEIEKMTWFDDILADGPSCAVCFPYAQHLICDSPGSTSSYASADDLERAARDIDFEAIPTFSTSSVRTGMMAGTAIAIGALAVLGAALAFALRRGKRHG